jgi:hypothetical protein
VLIGSKLQIFVFPIKLKCSIRYNTTTYLNSLTAKSVPAGTKNSHPVGFYSSNSTESTLHHKHKKSTNITTMVVPFAPHLA